MYAVPPTGNFLHFVMEFCKTFDVLLSNIRVFGVTPVEQIFRRCFHDSVIVTDCWFLSDTTNIVLVS